MRNIVFELCAESLQACLAARDGGAHRIELCTALNLGGLTPSHGLLRQALLCAAPPIHVLLRPRAGDFLYTDEEFAVIREDLLIAKALGASGVVLGLLHADATVDLERTRELVQLAAPLEVTFHRAFDSARSLDQALEDVIRTGCHRLLTSGGEPDVLAGANTLSRLVTQAAGRIEIAIGGGLRIKDAATLARTTAATHFHGSLRKPQPTNDSSFIVDPEDIQTIIKTLQNA